jgi:cobalt-zinc-cadmium efflux system outer membrane protein
LRSARRRVERLQNQVLADTEENLRLVTDGQRQGEFSLFQVHAARQLYSQSQLSYVESLTELRKLIVEIDGLLLTGGLNPAALGAAIQT